MRIVHVVTRLGLGGAERVAETLAGASAARGNQVWLLPIVASRDRVFADAMATNLTDHGVTVLRGAMSSIAKVGVLEGSARLAWTIARTRPDVVHLHTEIPEFTWALGSLYSRSLRNATVVRTIHNSVLWGGWERMGRFAEHRLSGARVAAVSLAARAAFLDWRATAALSPVSPVVIYNGVDLEGLPDRPGDLGDPPLLCFAGRFEYQKGIDVLLDSLERLTAADPAFRVAIYGAGSYGDAAAAGAARRPERIFVEPPVADLRARLRTFDAILMPSRFEGFGLLAVEALCSGVPVLATQSTGLDEVLPAGYPGRCPSGDPVAYAEVIRDFLQNPDAWRAHATKARDGARERFSLETMAAAYEHLYRVGVAPPAHTGLSTVDEAGSTSDPPSNMDMRSEPS